MDGPNQRGWFNVQLEDGRTATTKDKKLADTAFQSRGNAIKADITEKQNGDFLNIYLNKVETTGNGNGATATPAPTAEIPPSRDGERQNVIAAQWAFGRAVEALAASSKTPLDDLLDTDTFAKVETVAASLLAASRKLATS